MQSYKLEQIFKTRPLWQNGINHHLQRQAQAQYRNTSWWWHCQSRTLQNVLQSTLYGYNGSSANTYKTLMTMCSLIDNNKILKVYPKYALISSEQAENLNNTLMDILDMPAPDLTAFNLYLYHIPKGKSYLRKVLDENTNLNRLKQIETFCIENTQHFIRIYRNFNSTGNSSITVFSDQYTTDLINTLFVMLPHLMGIVSREANEEYTLTEEDIAYNQKVEKLQNIFKLLYRVMNEGANSMRSYNELEISNLTTELLRLTSEYAELFDFETAQLDSFTTRLAKARNDNAKKYFTDQLANVTRRIAELEESLKQKYVDQAKYNRELAAHKLIAEDDVKPFIDTIKNTKAIEVLSTSDTEMVLRVTAPLQYFQEADFTAYENNPTSTYMRNFYSNPILRKVLHKVFVTREYKILAQANIHLIIQDSYHTTPLNIYAERQNSSYASPITQFPNPHLYHHDCWGPAKTEMQKNMCEGNFELVVMQMVAAVQSVNVAENASFVNGFLNDLLNNDGLKKLITFIVDTPNGAQTLNYTQMLEYERNLEKQAAMQEAEHIINQAPKQAYTQVEIPDDDTDWDDPAERFERQHAEDIADEEGEDENEED